MKKENNITNKEKFDFSNKESQKLFEEFTLLLADITEYVEEREQRITYLEQELGRVTRIRFMLNELVRKFIHITYKILIYVPRESLKLLRKGKIKLKNLLK